MKPLTLHVPGRRLVRDEIHALYLDKEAPQQALRLALVIRGTERVVFPALALDDWGREKKGPNLMRWLYEEGPRFPRAELFGFDAAGDETQIFLRDLELSFAYPCFIYETAEAALPTGQRINTIFVPDNEQTADAPAKIGPPEDFPWSLRRAAVRWRRVSRQWLDESGWLKTSP